MKNSSNTQAFILRPSNLEKQVHVKLRLIGVSAF